MPNDAAGNPAQPAVAQTPPVAHPDFNRPPATAGENRPAPIYMEPSAYQAMMAERDELIQFKARAQKDFEAKEVERLAALAKAGQIEEALTETRKQGEVKHREAEQRYQALESAWLTEKKTASIAEALSGKTFIGQDPAATAGMLRKLLADEIEAARDSQGNPIVYDRTTRRPAADYLKERLERPDVAIFFASSHRGGAGTDGTRSTGAPNSNEDPTSAYMKEFRERMAASRSDPSRIFSQ